MCFPCQVSGSFSKWFCTTYKNTGYKRKCHISEAQTKNCQNTQRQIFQTLLSLGFCYVTWVWLAQKKSHIDASCFLFLLYIWWISLLCAGPEGSGKAHPPGWNTISMEIARLFSLTVTPAHMFTDIYRYCFLHSVTLDDAGDLVVLVKPDKVVFLFIGSGSSFLN